MGELWIPVEPELLVRVLVLVVVVIVVAFAEICVRVYGKGST